MKEFNTRKNALRMINRINKKLGKDEPKWRLPEANEVIEMTSWESSEPFKLGDEIIAADDFLSNRKWYEFWKPKYIYRKGDILTCTIQYTSGEKVGNDD